MKYGIWIAGVGLTAAVFADSLMFAPGNGVATNVSEQLVGVFDRVEINAGSTGGGIVNFMSPWNLYSGAAVVNSGMFLLSGDLRPMGQPSVLGRGVDDEVITVKDGTLSYAGAPAETDRGLTLAPTGAGKAAVVSVAADTSLKLTGPVTCENGVVIKRGEGTLVLAPSASAPTNVFCHASLNGTGALSFPANGDAPTAGYGEFTVQEGRLALDFPADSVNILHGGTVASGRDATIIGVTPVNETAAHEAHLEIRNGQFYASRYVFVGNLAGTILTTETPLHHSLDVYGGLFDNNHSEGCAIYVGQSAGSDNCSVGEVNIFGGTVRTFYFRPACSPGSVARVFVSGGTLDCYGVYAGQYTVGDNGRYITDWDDPDAALIPDLEIHVSTNGLLNLRGGPYYICRDSLVKHTLKVTDGGRMVFRGFTTSANDASMHALQQTERMTVLLDGGTLDFSTQNRTDMASLPGVTTLLGARGGRMNSGYAASVYTFWGPIYKAEGVERDGGLVLDGPATYRLFCENSFSGDVNLVGAGTLVLSNGLASAGVRLCQAGLLAAATPAVSLPSLVCTDISATLQISNMGGAATCYALGGFTPPAKFLYLNLGGTFSAGEYEIMNYPAATVFAADQVQIVGGNVVGGRRYSFRTETAGAVTKLLMKVEAAPTPSASAASWMNPAGGDWKVDGNWQGPAPTAAGPAAVTFAAAPSADPTTVTLDHEQQLTQLQFPSSPGYRVAGTGSILLDNGGSPATVTAAGGATNIVDVPVTMNGKVSFDIPKRGHVEFASVSGNANISTTVDSAGYGGVVKIDDASQLTGTISFQRGLLELGTMPAMLTALDIGFGEFRYTGAEAKRLACPINFIATQYSNSKVCVADPAGELHIDGTFTMPNGSFSKHGKGLLAFDGARNYSFAPNVSYYGLFDHTVQMTDVIADPKWGFMWESSGRDRSQPTTIAGGTMRWGVPGQSVSFGKVSNEALVVGGVSTAEPGKEFDAYAEINGGETEVKGILYTGYRHGYPGTAEHNMLTSRVTMTAGDLRGTQLYQLNDDKKVCASRSEWLQQGGAARFSGDLNFGRVGSAACSAFTEVSGGELGCDGNAFMGNDGNNRASSVVRLVGGLLDCKGGFYMCYGTNRLEVLEGGTLRTQAINSYANQKNRVLFDGGVFKPYHPTGGGCGCNENVREFALGAKGMVVDLSDYPVNVCTFSSPLSTADGVATDGGLIVRGLNGYNPGVIAFSTVVQQTRFSGNLTVEDGGNVRVASNPSVSSNFTVVVKHGGAFGAQWTSVAGMYGCVKNLALGESAADTAILQVQTGVPDYDGKYAGTVWATESLSVPGTVDVAFVSNFHQYFLLPSVKLTLLIAPKGSIDAAKFRLSAKCPTATANFAVESFNADYDKLTVTFSTPTAAEHVWTAAAGGNWSDPANWSVAPTDSAYDGIVFPATFAGGTIALGGDRTVMSVANAGEGEVSLTGGTLDFASSAATVSTVAGGELRLPQIVSEHEVAMNAAAPAGKVVLTESKGATVISSKSGTLEAAPANFGTGDVKIDKSTVSVTGDGMVNAKVAGTGGMNLRADGEAYFMKDVSVSGQFMKTGPGVAYLCGSSKVTLGSNNALSTNSDSADLATTHVPENGDMPTDSMGGAMTIAAGKLVLGVDGKQQVNVGARLDIGTSFYELDGEGNVLGAELEMLDGTLAGSGDLNIGRNPGRYAKETPALVGKRRDLGFTIRGGEASFSSFYMLHDNSGKFSGNVYLNVFGGHLKFKSTYLNIGYHYRAGSTNFVNVGDGLLEFTTTKPSWANGILGYSVVLNLTGGEFRTFYPLSSQQNVDTQYLVYNLAGGRLNVPCLRRVSTKGIENLFWDGGVYAPTTNDCSIACQQMWTKHECRQGGAKIDLSGVVPVNPGDPIAFSMNQTLAHAEELGAQEDGGIELLGGGTLTLDVANTMNGPVIASGGVVRPTVVGAVNGGVVVNGDGVFDVNGLAVAAAYLKGAGGTVAGGTLTVLGEIAPATFVTVGSLACGPDAVLKCPLKEEDEGVYTTTLVKVASNGQVVKEGKLAVDFCLDEGDMLPKDFSVKIAEIGENATFPAQLGVVKTGREPKHYQLDANFRAGVGCTEVWATLRGPATVIYFR